MAAFRPLCGGLLSRALLAGFLSACGGGDLLLPGVGAPEAPAPAAIRVFDGNGQSGQVGEPLPAPLVVLVTDAEGDPVAGATVVFQLTSAGDGAQVPPATDLTNAGGLAEAQPVLGDQVGLQTGEARVVLGATTSLKASFIAFARTDDSDNRRPLADYDWDCKDLSCEFDDDSRDDDGSVIAWHWQFGDGETSQEAEPEHRYPGSGTYLVTLTVTDDDGSTDQSTAPVEVVDKDHDDDD